MTSRRRPTNETPRSSRQLPSLPTRSRGEQASERAPAFAEIVMWAGNVRRREQQGRRRKSRRTISSLPSVSLHAHKPNVALPSRPLRSPPPSATTTSSSSSDGVSSLSVSGVELRLADVEAEGERPVPR